MHVIPSCCSGGQNDGSAVFAERRHEMTTAAWKVTRSPQDYNGIKLPALVIVSRLSGLGRRIAGIKPSPWSTLPRKG